MSETLKLENAINIDIPWAEVLKPKIVLEGTQAIVPEIGLYGERTGNNVHLTHEEYMHEMGGAALSKAEVAAGINPTYRTTHPIISTDGHIVPDAPPPLKPYHGQELPPDLVSQRVADHSESDDMYQSDDHIEADVKRSLVR